MNNVSEKRKKKSQEINAEYDEIKPDQIGVVTFAEHTGLYSRNKRGKERPKQEKIHRGVQVENTIWYVKPSTNKVTYAMVNTGAITQVFPYEPEKWDYRLVKVYEYEKQVIENRNKRGCFSQNPKVDTASIVRMLKKLEESEEVKEDTKENLQSRGINNDEEELLNKYRQLDFYGRKLIKQTLNTLLEKDESAKENLTKRNS